MNFNKKLNQNLKLFFHKVNIKYNIIKNLITGENFKYLILPFIIICLERLYNIFQEDLLNIIKLYYNNFLNITFQDKILMVLAIFVYWAFLFYNYLAQGLSFFRTLHFNVIAIFMSWVFSYCFFSISVLKIIIIFIKCLTLLSIFLMYYNKVLPSEEKKIRKNNI